MYPRPLSLPGPPRPAEELRLTAIAGSCPLTLELLTAELEGDTVLFLTALPLRDSVVPPNAVISPIARGAVISRRSVVLLLSVQAGFSSGTKRPAPHPPKISNFFFAIKKCKETVDELTVTP